MVLHFGHLKRLFRDVPHFSDVDSHIVNTALATPEDLNVQLTGVGVGKGPCEGVSKIQFYGQRGTLWKIEHLREMAFDALKKELWTTFFRRNSPFGAGCWHKFYGQHFLRIPSCP